MMYKQEGMFDWSSIHIFGQNGTCSNVAAFVWWQEDVYQEREGSIQVQETLKWQWEQFKAALDNVLYVFTS